MYYVSPLIRFFADDFSEATDTEFGRNRNFGRSLALDLDDTRLH